MITFYLLLSGLCFLPVLCERVYFVVAKPFTWSQAQSYCRAKYTDLATVENEEELQKVVTAAKQYYAGTLWIGLYDDINSWRWSLQKEGYYGPGEAQFRMWKQGSPDNYGGDQYCTLMMTDGTWNDGPCSYTEHFFCYDENTSPSFIHVTDNKTFSEAQSYCREYHTDLASVRNQSENDQLRALVSSTYTFIGLYRDSWKWSDGSPGLFRKWNTGRPFGKSCAFISQGLWTDYSCSTTMYSICHAVRVKQLIVKLKVQNPPLNLSDAMLQQLEEILEAYGLSKVTKLTWRRQPDGKIFYKQQEKMENIISYSST